MEGALGLTIVLSGRFCEIYRVGSVRVQFCTVLCAASLSLRLKFLAVKLPVYRSACYTLTARNNHT